MACNIALDLYACPNIGDGNQLTLGKVRPKTSAQKTARLKNENKTKKQKQKGVNMGSQKVFVQDKNGAPLMPYKTR
ncbi:MAG: hypothetical protein BTN85_2066 [Candidatus Methanohalarchaeum thermophilum]|uniref:Uncharacterized protein n=1 Tax=Methanohalarchaeum thermophilum TaxID=1903181 RepID=A0A1Q6DSS1_METT1|nr:MAG: hypothetical protein BTN85_2066 [Candidatus Methanohalarchaeum thermophilum]